MKPDWDKLIATYKDHKSILVADVDCTAAAAKAKCEEVGVRGYPTVKFGDPDDLQDYKGSRAFFELKKFADTLKPVCSPANLDLCDEEKKKLLAELQALSPGERDALIKEKEDAIEKLEADFNSEVTRLQKEYEEVKQEKEKTIQAAKKEGGLSLLKSVHSFEEKMAKREL
mmetsp:Transcript_107222/g.313525  ORF Transcript_107222/g.313525 Transcript_107222/m.313525 type:complete len:171 (+) Transcript_107222:28-540(+)